MGVTRRGEDLSLRALGHSTAKKSGTARRGQVAHLCHRESRFEAGSRGRWGREMVGGQLLKGLANGLGLLWENIGAMCSGMSQKIALAAMVRSRDGLGGDARGQ